MEPVVCSVCGASLPADAPAGLCPKCLLQAGMEQLTVVPSVGATAGSVEPGAEGIETDGRALIHYFGDYELLDEIARGGMGVVYKARQVSLNRVVALKMILAGRLANELDIQRFHAEAEAAARLDHPGIVPIYEIGEHQGQQFFSMGYVPGSSLASLIATGPLPPTEAAELVARIADAVQYAHDQGIVHRDLKPANVLIDDAGLPRVTDFGLAKQLQVDSGLTGTGQILGTPSFMPPEQAAGKTSQIGPTTDVYSLGAVLYCALTGRPPFQAATVIDTVMQVLERDPVPLRELNPQVPRDLETIALKCLEKDRARRYPSAKALVDELRCWLRGEPIQARPISEGERFLKWVRRRPLIAGLSLAVALSLIIGSIATLHFAIKADERAREATEREIAERKALAELKSNFYLNLIARADSEWRAGNSARALKILDECDKDLRSWEWNYLHRLCHPEGRVLNHASGQTIRVGFSPSGKFLAAATEYQDLQIWNLRTGQHAATRRLHPAQIVAFAVSQDDARLISVDGAGNAFVWNTADGSQQASFKDWRGIAMMEFHSDGIHVLTNLGIRNCETGETTLTLPQIPQLLEIGYGPEESEIWTIQPAGLVRYDLAGTLVGEQPANANGLLPARAVLSRDRQQIVGVKSRLLNNTTSTSLGVFDAMTLEPITWLGDLRATELLALTLSSDGRLVAAVTRDTSNSHGLRWLSLWDARTGRLLARMEARYPMLQHVAIDPSGPNLAWANGPTVMRWKLPAIRGARKIARTSAPLIGLGVVEKDHRIIWGDRTGDIRDLDIATGRTRDSLTILNEGRSHLDERARLAIDRDGHWVALSADLSVRSLKLQTRDNPVTMKTLSASNYFTRAVMNPGKQQIVAADATAVKFWNMTTGDSTATDLPVENASATAGSADGKRLAVATFAPGPTSNNGSPDAEPSDRHPIQIVDLETSKVVFQLGGLPTPAACLAFNSDGTLLAAATGINSHDYGTPQPVKGVIRVWDLQKRSVMMRLPGHAADVSQVAFSNDNRRLFSSSADGTVKVWDMKSGQEVLTLRGHPNQVKDLSLGDRGLLVTGGGPASSGEGEILIWDGRPIESGLELPILDWPSESATEAPTEQVVLNGFKGAMLGMAVSAKDQFLAGWPYGADQPLVIWDLKTRQVIAEIPPTAPVSGATYSPNGTRLAVVRSNNANPGILHLLKAGYGEADLDISGAIGRPAYDRSGKLIAAGFVDGQGRSSLRIWDAETGQQTGSVDRVSQQACLSDDGSRVAGVVGSTVIVADVSTGRVLTEYQEPGDYVRNLTLSPDGTMVTASGSGVSNIPGSLRIHRVPGGEVIRELRGHTGWFANAVFNGDGTLLATCSSDRTIKVWDVASGQLINTFRDVEHDITHIRFLHDSRRLVSASFDGRVNLWTIDE